MNTIDFLNSPELELPKSWDKEYDSFDGYFSDMYNNYLTILNKVNNQDYVSETLKANAPLIQKLCDNIREVIRLQFEGQPAKAFDKFKSALDEIEPHINVLFSPKDIAPNLDFMYRIRRGSSAQMRRKDLFHIPFEKRHLVSTQRYSIPGLPCLYLGGSTYICWEELGRPDLHTIHIARFKPVEGKTLKVLDFGKRPSEIATFLEHYQKTFLRDGPIARYSLAHGICWPLMAACSIRVRFEEAPFKPEYIIPQLLLQWVTENDEYDGIRYFSTQVTDYFDDSTAVSNLVFPARSSNPSGFCKQLSAKFELSEPLYWQLAKGCALSSEAPQHIHFELKIAEGVKADYLNTEFGEMQMAMAALPCQTI